MWWMKGAVSCWTSLSVLLLFSRIPLLPCLCVAASLAAHAFGVRKPCVLCWWKKCQGAPQYWQDLQRQRQPQLQHCQCFRWLELLSYLHFHLGTAMIGYVAKRKGWVLHHHRRTKAKERQHIAEEAWQTAKAKSSASKMTGISRPHQKKEIAWNCTMHSF